MALTNEEINKVNTLYKENDDLKDQQLILFWLLFIIAGIGFSF